MAYTPVSLNIQNLLETTFISDMRLIINANNAVLKTQTEDLFNTFEVDLVNKYIGVDNYIGQVKTNNVILGNGIQFMDSTTMIANLSKSSGKSILSIDKIIIQAGGSIDNSGAANAIVSKRLGVGIALTDVTTDGFFVGNSSTSVNSEFNGLVTFVKQAVVSSTEGTSNTQISTVNASITVPSAATAYYGEITLAKTGKQFIYVTVKAPVAAVPGASNPIYIGVYESATDTPVAGQSFTVIIKDFTNSAGTSVAVANWGEVYFIPGFDISTIGSKKPGLINGGSLSTSGSAATYIDGLSTTTQYVQCYNANIEPGTAVSKAYGASFNLTKFENVTNAARYVITSSHNIEIIN
jgi:hypothetical protein